MAILAEGENEDWTSPGVYLVGDGVYRIPLPLPNDGLRAVNVYAIKDGDGVVLVDSGWALEAAEERLASALDELGHDFSDIHRFLITHIHRDHYTQAIAIRRRFGTHVSIGHDEEPSLAATLADRGSFVESLCERLRECGAPDLARGLAARAPTHTGERSPWELPDRWLDAPERIELHARALDCVATPGHTRGHLVYRDGPQALLFAGDHLLPHITPSIGYECVPTRSPLASYIASIKLVRAMPDLKLLPAHGGVAPSTHQRCDELLEHHDARLDAAEKAVVGGATNALEVAHVLRWTRRERTLDELDPANQELAVLEAASHLQVLVEQARLRSFDRDGVTYFEAT